MAPINGFKRFTGLSITGIQIWPSTTLEIYIVLLTSKVNVAHGVNRASRRPITQGE